MTYVNTHVQERHTVAQCISCSQWYIHTTLTSLLPHRIRAHFDKHAILEFGSYVQTHEEHTNDMSHCTLGAVCLGPTGNRQGGHWFMSLSSGA